VLPRAAWRVIREVLVGLFLIGLVTWMWPDYISAHPGLILGGLIAIGFNVIAIVVRAIKTPKIAE
jgi:hypothetical protein